MVENKTLDYLDDATPLPIASPLAVEEEETVNLLSPFDNSITAAVVAVEPPMLISAIKTSGGGRDTSCEDLNSPVAEEEADADAAEEKNRVVVGAGVASGVVGL
jgi:triosephosphate isomerase